MTVPAVRHSTESIVDIQCTCRFQDGAATANNPAALALAEARALWPDTPVDVLVSIGSGDTPPARRERSVSTYLETGNVLIESATDTQRVAAALATLAPLVPGLRYFRYAALPGPLQKIDILCMYMCCLSTACEGRSAR